VAHYYACKFGVNRLRNDGDIQEKVAIMDNCDLVVIAIYRLRPIQKLAPSGLTVDSSCEPSQTEIGRKIYSKVTSQFSSKFKVT